ncbi:MAG TPA: ferritin-like protein [Actinomycetota bacterium]|nr:ferritin-like protein [Actinomycetota bacterium]
MVSAIQSAPIDATQPIRDRHALQNHLIHAAQLELSTIPLYLYAAYSIQTQSYWSWNPGMSALRTIRSVVIEEMLHLCLARNLMVAIGGGERLHFYDKGFVPTYPSPMLHRIPELLLHLEACTESLMENVFMPLELPAKTDAPPQPHRYNTIGQFYAAIVDGFKHLDSEKLWADNQPDLQYQSAYWNNDGGGSPVLVCNLDTALEAIATIVEQGEGLHPGDDEVPIEPQKPTPGANELSHYAKFQQIQLGIDQIGVTWPVPTDPKASDFQGTPAEGLAEFFNAAYSYVLAMIDALYSTSRTTVQPGARSPRYGLERTFIGAMNGLLFPIANLLVATPISASAHAAPTFEFHAFAESPPKKEQLAAMCDGLLGRFPALGGDNGVRTLIGLLPPV